MPMLPRRVVDRARWELREWRTPSRPAFIHEELDQALLDEIAWRPRERVLDVGCGSGKYMQALARRRPAVFGIDINKQALRVAFAGGNPVAAADAMELPFADGAFDAVLCHKTLYLFAQADRAAAELARMVRPGGRLVFSTSNPASPYARVQRLAATKDRRPNWARGNAWSAPQWCREFARHGFATKAIYSCNLVWPIVFRVCDKWIIPNEWMRRYNRLVRRVTRMPLHTARPIAAAMDYVVEMTKRD